VIAVYDCIGAGTGFVGNHRQARDRPGQLVRGKKTALTSIPYSRVNAVSFVSDKSMWGFASTSSISVSAGGREYLADFRGEQKAKHVHDVILWHMMKP
jgi:hypothetical protein